MKRNVATQLNGKNADQAHRGAERGRHDAQLRQRAARPAAAAAPPPQEDEEGARPERTLLPQPSSPRLSSFPGMIQFPS